MRYTLNTAILVILFSLGSYIFGYISGGHDFVYFEKISSGMTSATVMDTTRKREEKSQLIWGYVDYKITDALWEHIERKDNVSILASYVIPNFSKEQVDRRIDTIINYEKRYGYDIGCDKPIVINKEFSMKKNECDELQSKVNAIIEDYPNR